MLAPHTYTPFHWLCGRYIVRCWRFRYGENLGEAFCSWQTWQKPRAERSSRDNRIFAIFDFFYFTLGANAMMSRRWCGVCWEMPEGIGGGASLSLYLGLFDCFPITHRLHFDERNGTVFLLHRTSERTERTKWKKKSFTSILNYNPFFHPSLIKMELYIRHRLDTGHIHVRVRSIYSFLGRCMHILFRLVPFPFCYNFFFYYLFGYYYYYDTIHHVNGCNERYRNRMVHGIKHGTHMHV